MDKEKYVGNSKIKEKPTKPLKLKLSERIKALFADLQNQIDSLTIHGMAVSNSFGDNPHIGISQKTLTEAFNRVWNKLEDITGEVLRGISMVVTPSYYVGEDGCSVHITASSIEATSIFEEIWFYWNDSTEPFAGSEIPISHFEFDTEITETTYIKCKAKIMGIWYEDYKLITHYPSIWIGAGNNYQDVMNDAHIAQLKQHMRGEVDVTASNGNRIYIIMAESLAQGFIRADMNGIEIAFTESTVTIDGKNYKVFASEDTYQAGTYNIDING